MKLPASGIFSILATALGFGSNVQSLGTPSLKIKPCASGFDPTNILRHLQPGRTGIQHHPVSFQKPGQRKTRLDARRANAAGMRHAFA